jgi:hypothetical protein
MNDGEKSTGQQPANEAIMPSRPQKFQPNARKDTASWDRHNIL